jgi:hypothetical protein
MIFEDMRARFSKHWAMNVRTGYLRRPYYGHETHRLCFQVTMNEVCQASQQYPLHAEYPYLNLAANFVSSSVPRKRICDIKHDSCTEGFGPFPDNAPGVVSTYREQYTCMHYALLAHAAAVDEFRRGGYKGKIGIKIDGGVSLPLDPTSAADRAAAARTMDFVSVYTVVHTIAQFLL